MQAKQENKKLLLFLFSKKLDKLKGKSECFFIPIFFEVKIMFILPWTFRVLEIIFISCKNILPLKGSITKLFCNFIKYLFF